MILGSKSSNSALTSSAFLPMDLTIVSFSVSYITNMSRKVKILLGIFLPIIIISAGFGIIFLTANWPAVWNSDSPIIDFPLANSNAVGGIWGFGDHDGEFHGGIDFICNESVNIIACCKLRIKMVDTFLNDVNGFWQTSIRLQYSFGLSYIFQVYFHLQYAC